MTKKKITQEDIEKKTEELVKMIKAFDGSKSDAAVHVCFEVVNWSSYNYFEAIGILIHTLFLYKETCEEVDEEEAHLEAAKKIKTALKEIDKKTKPDLQ